MTVPKRWRRDAFTLVELLVTIAIIIVLTGLIMPAIKGARERGRDVLCKNHLKELQIAAMSVAISGDGSLPRAKSSEYYDLSARKWIKNYKGWLDWANYVSNHDPGQSGRPRPGETPWWGPMGLTCITNGSLWPYVNSTKTYSCPEWQRKDVCGANDPMGGLLTFGATNNVPWRCYAMNSQVSGANIGNFEASKYVLFTEAGNTNYLEDGTTQIAQRNFTEKLTYTFSQSSSIEAYGWDGCLGVTPVTSMDYPTENVGLYHNGKANAVFVDGHIEKLDWNVTTNAFKGLW